MATAGSYANNQLTALSERHKLNRITDNVYGHILLFFRLNQNRKRQINGGFQIEVPLLYKKHTNGGRFSGWEILDVSPQDTVLNAAWDWAQHYGSVSIDKKTLIRADTTDKLFNLLQTKFEQLEMDMVDKLATALHTDGSDADEVLGTEGAVDDGGVLTTYAGLSRTTYTWWKANDDSTTTTLTKAALRSMKLSCQQGGRSTSLIGSDTDQYSRFLAMGEGSQEHPVGSGGHDEQLYSAGFTNALWMNIPWSIDDQTFIPSGQTDSAVVFYNEHYLELGVSPNAEFTCTPFQRPADQLGWASVCDWAGNLICDNPSRQGKLSAIAA